MSHPLMMHPPALLHNRVPRVTTIRTGASRRQMVGGAAAEVSIRGQHLSIPCLYMISPSKIVLHMLLGRHHVKRTHTSPELNPARILGRHPGQRVDRQVLRGHRSGDRSAEPRYSMLHLQSHNTYDLVSSQRKQSRLRSQFDRLWQVGPCIDMRQQKSIQHQLRTRRISHLLPFGATRTRSSDILVSLQCR